MGNSHKRRKVRICTFLAGKFFQQPCRYVAELLKMKDTFINPLLHPCSNPSSFILVEHNNMSPVQTLVESLERLPIAPAAGSDDSEDHNTNARATSHASRRRGQPKSKSVSECDPREPLDSRTPRSSFVSIFLSRLSLRSHPRRNRKSSPAAPLVSRPSVELSPTEKDQDRDCMSTSTDPTVLGMQQMFTETSTKADLFANDGVAPHQLPDDLRLCLEGIESILEDHLKLIGALRKRYKEQYPLVRTLADVFMNNVRSLSFSLTSLIIDSPGSSYTSSGAMRAISCI